MKRLFGNIVLATVFVAFINSNSVAQEGVKRGNFKSTPHKAMIANASDEQKAIMKENFETVKNNRAKLQATYTAQQKEILANKELNPKAKHEALQATYTSEQKQLIENNKKEMLAGKEKLMNTLSDEQKTALNARKTKAGKFNKDSLKRPVKKMDASGKTALQGRRAPAQGGGFNIPNATEEQKALMTANKEKRSQQKTALEATYTAKQKEIIADKSLDPKAKREALQATYTEAQKQLIAKQREEAKADREKLMKTLTEEQKSSLKRK